jgi:hypothetical protein
MKHENERGILNHKTQNKTIRKMKTEKGKKLKTKSIGTNEMLADTKRNKLKIVKEMKLRKPKKQRTKLEEVNKPQRKCGRI